MAGAARRISPIRIASGRAICNRTRQPTRVALFDVIHSLDRPSLLAALARRWRRRGAKCRASFR